METKNIKKLAKIFIVSLIFNIIFPAVSTFAAGLTIPVTVCPTYQPNISSYPNPSATLTWSYPNSQQNTSTKVDLQPNSSKCNNGFQGSVTINAPEYTTVTLITEISSGGKVVFNSQNYKSFDQLRNLGSGGYRTSVTVTADSGPRGIAPKGSIHYNTYFQNTNNPLPLKPEWVKVTKVVDGVSRTEVTKRVSNPFVANDYYAGENLPDGTYKLEVNELMTDVFNYWETQIDTLQYVGTFAATAAALCVIVPGCAVTALSAAAIGGGLALAGKELKEFWKNNTEGEDRVAGYIMVTVKNGVASPEPANLVVQHSKVSPLTEAMAKAVLWLAQFITSALKVGVNYINELLMNTKDWVLGGDMNKSWLEIRNIALSLLVLGLIIIAFANVLQIDIQRYGLNRMIPRIIIAIIMSYFSWLIVVFFFDFTLAIQRQAIGLIDSHSGGLERIGNISIVNPEPSQIISSIGMFLVTIALLIIILISVVVLLFSLLLRVVYLSFLLVIAPLAFILMIMPFSEGLYKKWWQEFWKWMFMGPMALVIIAIGSVISAPSGTSNETMIDPNGITATETLIKLLILAAAVYFAGTLPKQWGGSIMASWQGAGKKAWGATGGWALKTASDAAWARTGGRAVNRTKLFFTERRRKLDEMDRLAVSKGMAAITKKNPEGFWRNRLAGNSFNKDIAWAQRQNDYQKHQSELVKTYGLDILDEDELKDRFGKEIKLPNGKKHISELTEAEKGIVSESVKNDPLASAYWKIIATNGWTNNGPGSLVF